MKFIYLFLIGNLSVCIQLQAQENKNPSVIFFKKSNSIVPRFGIGLSRHFITEVGFGFANSKFIHHKQLGLNTTVRNIYISYETMTPYKKPLINGYKVGLEYCFIGHVTSAGGIEIAYYTKSDSSSFALIPKIGLPLMYGSISYGFSMYFNPNMRKEIGRHRIILTYSLNRKSRKILNSFLNRKES